MNEEDMMEVILCYVDDIAVLFKSIDEFKEWAEREDIQKIWRDYGIELNHNKTEILSVQECQKQTIDNFKIHFKTPKDLKKETRVDHIGKTINELEIIKDNVCIKVPVVRFAKYLGHQITIDKDTQYYISELVL